MFFEGSEKKIEVIFGRDLPSLRLRPRAYWETLVDAAQAQILSEISNEHMTAYLLSESSLFVYDHFLIMITCGTTRLVNAVEELMKEYSPDQIQAFFYERKNELLPQAQITDFFKDVTLLKTWFEGDALRYGREDEHHVYLFGTNKAYEPSDDDHTLEILMHGIDPKVTEMFREGPSCNVEELRKKSGIVEIVCGEIDDHVFDPMGYSLNSIDGSRYFTIHITPESDGSYISFETNAFKKADQVEWTQKVIEVFNPTSFDMVIFNKGKIERPDFGHYILKRQYAERLPTGYDTQYFSYYQPNDSEQRPTRF